MTANMPIDIYKPKKKNSVSMYSVYTLENCARCAHTINIDFENYKE